MLRTTVAGSGLAQGTAQSLDAKLGAALAAIAAGNQASACAALQDALNFPAAQRGKKIPAAQADAIRTTVAGIRGSLGC